MIFPNFIQLNTEPLFIKWFCFFLYLRKKSVFCHTVTLKNLLTYISIQLKWLVISMVKYTYSSLNFMHQTIFSTDVFFMLHLFANFFTYYLTNYGIRTKKPFKYSDYLLVIGFKNRNPKLLLI